MLAVQACTLENFDLDIDSNLVPIPLFIAQTYLFKPLRVTSDVAKFFFMASIQNGPCCFSHQLCNI